MKHQCSACRYSTGVRSNFNKHLKTRKHLKKVNSNTKTPTKSTTPIQIIPKYSKSIENIPNIPNYSKNIPNYSKNICHLCGKSYSAKYNLNKHLKRNHKNLSDSGISESESDDPDIPHSLIPPQFSSQNPHEYSIGYHQCDFCMRAFSRLDNLKRHQDNCNAKSIFNRNRELEMDSMKKEIRYTNKMNDFLEKEVIYYKKIIGVAGGMATKAVGSLSHIVTNYEDAPPIEKVKLIDVRKLMNTENRSIKDYENRLIDEIFHSYNHGNVGQYIGDIIIKLYKKDDPSQQSLWNTDSSRLTYLIKKMEDDDDTSRWTVDKKGVETVDYVIEPIVKKIKQLADTFRDENCPSPDDIDSDDEEININRIMLINTIYAKLMIDIDNKKVHNDILKYISSYFYLKKD